MPNLFGFNEKQVAVDLFNFVKSGAINTTPVESNSGPQPRTPASRIWMATASTTITAATGGDAGTTYVVGGGTAYLLELRPSDAKLLKSEASVGGTWRTVQVYNLYDNAIPVSTKLVFPVIQDGKGIFWVASPIIFKPHCRFTLNSALATSESSKAATITDQWGQGIAHPTTAITVENLLTKTAGLYLFEGVSGAAGRASYKSGTNWNIENMECGGT